MLLIFIEKRLNKLKFKIVRKQLNFFFNFMVYRKREYKHSVIAKYVIKKYVFIDIILFVKHIILLFVVYSHFFYNLRTNFVLLSIYSIYYTIIRILSVNVIIQI